MNFFTTGKNDKNLLRAKPPVIRKEVRTVTVAKPKPKQPVPPAQEPRGRPVTNSSPTTEPDKVRKIKAAPLPRSRVAEVRRGQKRKSSSPSDPVFGSSSDESDDSDSSAQQTRKRPRTTSNVCKRSIRDRKNWSPGEASAFTFVHGIDLTSGDRARGFHPAFGLTEATEVELQYPSKSCRERFLLVQPKESGDYSPIADIVSTVAMILEHYLPPSVSDPLLNQSTGLVFRLRRAYNHGDIDGFRSALSEFNSIVHANLMSSVVAETLDSTSVVSTALIERILAQIYSRTVSPQVDQLRKYEAGSDNVYGELLPGFVSQIFRDTKLAPNSIFLDLGSGVGNVVLQAALEMGCESYGIEMMDNPAKLGKLQTAEFPARARLWGLAAGSVELVHGNFLEHPRCSELISKADVVLINNQAFTPKLNDAITSLFLDLKNGARVVSLKSFMPTGWRFGPRTQNSVLALLAVERKEYWKGCVSWTDQGGEYYISTKDYDRARMLERRNGTAGRRK